MSETLSVIPRTIERVLSLKKKAGVLKREGKDNNGYGYYLFVLLFRVHFRIHFAAHS